MILYPQRNIDSRDHFTVVYEVIPYSFFSALSMGVFFGQVIVKLNQTCIFFLYLSFPSLYVLCISFHTSFVYLCDIFLKIRLLNNKVLNMRVQKVNENWIEGNLLGWKKCYDSGVQWVFKTSMKNVLWKHYSCISKCLHQNKLNNQMFWLFIFWNLFIFIRKTDFTERRSDRKIFCWFTCQIDL